MPRLILDQKELPSLQEGFNSISGAELNMIFNKSYLADNVNIDLQYKLNVGLTVRSIYTNKVLIWHTAKAETLKTRWIKEDSRDLVGYFLAMVNVQEMLNETLDYESDVIRRSVLQPIGLVKDCETLIVVFHLILKDEDMLTLKLKGIEEPPVLMDIEELNNFTNLSHYTKIILPTLKIVRSENIENQSDR